MKKLKKTVNTILIIVFLLALSINVFAESNYNVPNFTVVQQAKNQWCWAASGEMAGKCFYSNTNRTQWDGVLHVKGSYVNVPSTSSDAAKVANHVCYGNKNFYVNSIWNITSIRRDIKDYGYPLITLAGYYNSSGNRTGGHFTVLNGVYETSSWIRYADPWDATQHWCSYQSFIDGSYNERKYEETVYAR